MFGSNGKISNRQSFFLFLFDFVGASSLIVPTYLAREVGAGGIFSILFGCVLGLLYLLLLHEIQGKMETDLGKWMHDRVTARKCFLMHCWLFLHCIAVAGFAAYLFSTLIQKRLLAIEHYPVILMVILAVSGYAVSGGIESRARVYEVLAILIFVPLVLMLIASGTQMESAYLEGFPEADFVSLIKGGYLVFLFFAVAFWTLFFTGFLVGANSSSMQAGSDMNAKNKADATLRKQVTDKQDTQIANQKRKQEVDLQNISVQQKRNIQKYEKNQISAFYQKVSLAIILTGILIAAIFLICLGNFGEAALSRMDFPVITLMSSIKISGNFVKRLDTIMIALWFFTLFAFLNLHIFYAVKMLEEMIQYDGNCHEKGKRKIDGYYIRKNKSKNIIDVEEKRNENEKMNSKITGQSSTNDIKGVTRRTVKSDGNCAVKSNQRISYHGSIIQIWIILLLSGIVALFFHYNENTLAWFETYIWYIGTPLLVLAPIFIYWAGRGKT